MNSSCPLVISQYAVDQIEAGNKMRLNCPNCDAQYEVPDAVIPAEGRDVQCSDCGQTWFQHHPDHAQADEPRADDFDVDADEQVVAPKPGQGRVQRKVEDSIQSILREEAERETAARARDTGSLESQPELGLDEEDFERRNRESQERMARLRGEQNLDAIDASGSRRNLLPDIEEINSSLRSTNDRRDKSLQMSDINPDDLNRRGSFWGGFMFIVLIVAVAIGVYVFAPEIAKAIPQADPWLSTYVSKADTVRVWLNGHLAGALEWLEQTAASQEG